MKYNNIVLTDTQLIIMLDWSRRKKKDKSRLALAKANYLLMPAKLL